MKKSRVFMAAGALALAISAVFASKANKKFKSVTTGNGANDNYSVSISSAAVFTTSNNSSLAVYAELCTSTGFIIVGKLQLFTLETFQVPILYK